MDYFGQILSLAPLRTRSSPPLSPHPPLSLQSPSHPSLSLPTWGCSRRGKRACRSDGPPRPKVSILWAQSASSCQNEYSLSREGLPPQAKQSTARHASCLHRMWQDDVLCAEILITFIQSVYLYIYRALYRALFMGPYIYIYI